MNKCNTGLSWEQDIHKEQMFGRVLLAYGCKLTGVVVRECGPSADYFHFLSEIGSGTIRWSFAAKTWVNGSKNCNVTATERPR